LEIQEEEERLKLVHGMWRMESWVKKRKELDGAKMGKNGRLWITAATGGEREKIMALNVLEDEVYIFGKFGKNYVLAPQDPITCKLILTIHSTPFIFKS